MNAYRVFIDGYAAESTALVLAPDREAAHARAAPNLDADDGQQVRVVREPRLDGDGLTDKLLWDTGTVEWSECTWCGEPLRRGSHNVLFDRLGNIYCNGVCILDADGPIGSRIAPQTEPPTLVMVGTEY